MHWYFSQHFCLFSFKTNLSISVSVSITTGGRSDSSLLSAGTPGPMKNKITSSVSSVAA